MPHQPPGTLPLEAAIAREVSLLASHLDLAGEDAAALVSGARRAVTGGKRLRARLCIASAEACGARVSNAESPAVCAGAALEFFQAAALAHDDLMDGSDTRRGEPASHRWFAAQAPQESGGRSAREFGASGAILVGDLLLASSATILHRGTARLSAPVRTQVDELYAAMAAEVALGQFLDLIAAYGPWPQDSGMERAWRVITAKSARYSVELPLLLGAKIAGASSGVQTWLTDVGRRVGIAFQLRDDLLGVFGDPQVTGKPAGDDLREGKRTVLVALAHQRADPTQRALLERDLGRRDLDVTLTAALQAVLIETGARDAVENLISEHGLQAQRLLDAPPVGIGDVSGLAQLLRSAIERES